MSHTGNCEQDFEDLLRLNLDEETEKAVIEVRLLARRIIDQLEPLHIDGYPSLIVILENCLETAKMEARCFYYLQKNKQTLDSQEKSGNQRTIGTIVDKSPGAKGLPASMPEEKSNRPLLKDLFSAIGKPAPWEIPTPPNKLENS